MKVLLDFPLWFFNPPSVDLIYLRKGIAVVKQCDFDYFSSSRTELNIGSRIIG
jgi:hypothetical protein